MQKKLRVLIIEDCEEDSLRVVNELYKGGYDPVDKRVETAEDMQMALAEEEWDLIISDMEMPNFSGELALKEYHDRFLDIPFIIFSGAIGVETAAKMMRMGAHDYISKSDLTLLIPAIERELNESENRREFKVTVESLRISEEKYRTLYYSSRDAIMLLAPDAGYTSGNPATIEMFKCRDEAEFLENTLFDLSPEFQPDGKESSEKAALMIRRALEKGSHFFEWTHMRVGGSIFPATVLLTKFGEKGDNKLQATVRDITARKFAEDALKESEEKFRAITNAANDAIIMMNSKGNISYWNSAAEKIFGYSSDEILGKNLHTMLVPDRFIDAYREAFPKFLKTGQGGAIGETLELAGIRKDGNEFPLELSLSSIQIDGKWHSVSIIRDTSARKQFEVQLMQSQKMESIGTLAAGIAHEINTPTQFIGNNIRFLEDSFEDLSNITSIIGELIEDNKRTDSNNERLNAVSKAMEDADYEFLIEEIPKAIKQSKRGIQNVTRIVSAMRSFAHPGTEEKSLTDIHNAIQSTVTISRNEWKYVADLETDFDSALPAVPCYVGEFNQVILNLIVNAAHAIGKVINEKKAESKLIDGIEGFKEVDLKGKIKIATKKNEDNAEIRISDSGCGISQKIMERVFDPFFTTKDVGKGTGQGLTIAYNVIVEKHGGEITFESEEGIGTTFVIRLPLS